MMDKLKENPFSSLFSSDEAAQRAESSSKKEKQDLGDLLKRVFLFTASGTDTPMGKV